MKKLYEFTEHNYYNEPISIDLIDKWLFEEWSNKLLEIKNYGDISKKNDSINYLDMLYLNNLELATVLQNQARQSYIFLINTLKNEEYGLVIWSDLFVEVEACIEYIIELIDSDRNIFTSVERVHMYDVYFHKQMSTYNYLFSLLDKITDLLYASYNWSNEKKVTTKNGKIYFEPNFKEIIKFYIKEELLSECEIFVEKIFKSEIWRKLKNIRINQNHKFHDFPDTYNISCEILMLLVLILRISYSIKINFNEYS